MSVGGGWTAHRGPGVYCVGCGERVGEKPGDGCGRPEHAAAYERMLGRQGYSRDLDVDFVMERLGGRCSECGTRADSRVLLPGHKNGDGSVSDLRWSIMAKALRAGTDAQAYDLRCANCRTLARAERISGRQVRVPVGVTATSAGKGASREERYVTWLRGTWERQFMMRPGETDEMVRMLRRAGRFEVPAGWQPEASV